MYSPQKRRQQQSPGMAVGPTTRLKGGAVPKADFASLYFFVVKSSVGVGCLALPAVFHSAGWLLGSLMACLICASVTFGIFALLRTKHFLERRGRTVTGGARSVARPRRRSRAG